MTKDSRAQTAAVEVALRIRPLTDRDRAQPRFASISENDVLRVHNNTVHIVSQGKSFHFDQVFRPSCTQSEIFASIGEKLVRKFVDGYNVTILAYGQTSSGKTYTMGTEQQHISHNMEKEGIVPRAVSLLFDLLQTDTRPSSPTSSCSSASRPQNRIRPLSRLIPPPASSANNNGASSSPAAGKHRFSVKVSFIEIYNEELVDLLNPAPPNERPPITIREDPKGHIYWTGVRELAVQSADDVLSYLRQGTQNRATGATDMNEKSSRSHAILSVTLRQERWSPSVTAKSTSSSISSSRPVSPAPTMKGSLRPSQQPLRKPSDENGEWVITTSKFHFVDLAGSERLKRTAAEGDRRKEGININAGLSALGNVISVLGDPSKRNTHIPYRDSKLTRLLQDSLGGNATTLMIACASPAEYNLPETLNTLQYASRARNIKNKIEKNEVEEWITTDNIELLRNMVASLRNELRDNSGRANDKAAIAGTAANSPELAPVLSTSDFDQVYQDQRMLIADLQRQVEELDGEASVTRERNRMVEDELKRLRQGIPVDSVNFQHFAEPVIEEYEKTISVLESQRAMDRAALNHADLEIGDLQRKLEQYEIVMEDQERLIDEQEKTINRLKKRENANEAHIKELGERMVQIAMERANEEDMLTDLRGKILRFQEMDDSTEQHIQELERRLADANQAQHDLSIELRETKVKKQELEGGAEILKKRLDEMNAKLMSVTEERDKLRSGTSSATNGGSMTTTPALAGTDELHETSIEERKALIQQITRLQENVLALQSQSEEREQNAEERLKRIQEQLDRVVREKQEAATAHAEEIEVLKSHLYKNGVEKANVLKTPPPSTSTRSNNDGAANSHFKEMTSKYIALHDQFSTQAERLDTALEKIRSVQDSRAEMVMSRKHVVLMRRVSDLERQLAKQKQRIEDEIFKFEMAFDESFQEKNEARIDAVLLKAEHDLENLVVGTTKLEAKLQKTEMALAAGRMYERDMEELRHKMDAMIIQQELVDRESTSQQRRAVYDDYKVYS